MPASGARNQSQPLPSTGRTAGTPAPAEGAPARPAGAARPRDTETRLLPAAPPLVERDPGGVGAAPSQAHELASTLMQEIDVDKDGVLEPADGDARRPKEAPRQRAERVELTRQLLEANAVGAPHERTLVPMSTAELAQSLHRDYGNGAAFDAAKAQAVIRSEIRSTVDVVTSNPVQSTKPPRTRRPER